jgi:AcrR family transcriptional regulator
VIILPKEKILQAAFELFSKGHYNSVALSQIAEKAGIKKASIYAHFASKENLFLEVFDNEIKRVCHNVQKIMNDNKDSETEIILQQFLIRSIEYIRENAPVGGFWSYLLFVTQHDLHDQIIIRINEFRGYMGNILVELIRKGIDKGEISNQNLDDLVYSYVCLLQGNLIMELNSKVFHMDKVNNSWNYFWRGVKSTG